jgi:CubicO group peptidase (beta-lactamase class C family)
MGGLRVRASSIGLLAFLLASATPVLAAPAAADSPQVAPSGATFTLPRAWSLMVGPKLDRVTPPEAGTALAIVDIPKAADAKAAAAQAWSLYRPDAHHPFKLMTARPPRDGWDERAIIDYEISPNDKAAIQALTFRQGDHWTVLIEDARLATAEKRAAAIGLVSQTLRPAGYKRETFAGRAAHPLNAARIEALRSFVETSMAELGVPGVGLALIDHGQVVYQGGVGVRALGSPEPVDAHTLFMIASNTKGMSTLLLARLADQGKVDWDQKVIEVYPAFRLGSDQTTSKVLMRNLVCACTGLPRKDYDWLFGTTLTTPASTTFTQLAATEPTSGFGEVFQYNNLMASAAGYIGGHLVSPNMELGAAYDGAMQSLIFNPLGMTETTFDMEKAQESDHASPHGDDINGHPALARMGFNYTIVPYRPAGGAWSSAHDVAKYVQDELRLGVLPDGTRLVSEKNLLARRTPGVPIGEDAWYGMGLEIDRTWGVPVIHHGGSMAGFKTDWMALPDAGIGAVILTNADDGQMLLRPFMRRLLEVVYDGKPEAAADVAAAAARNQAEIAAERKRLVLPAASAAAVALAPRYANPELGQLVVTHSGPRTLFDFGLWQSEVASRQNNDGTISFVTIDPTNSGFEFVMERRDGRVVLVIHDRQHEYIYTPG